MRLLITGGTGFIGTNFINRCIKEGFKVYNVDNLSLFTNDNVITSKNYTFQKLDINNDIELFKILISFKPNRIINFAAETHVDFSIKNPLAFLNSNVIGTFKLLDTITKYKNSKYFENNIIFHQISTDEVFGSLGFSKQRKFFNEKSKYFPNSPYSSSKASADHLVRAWHRTHDIDYIITYCSNNYGPFQHPSKFIPKVIINNILQKKIPIYGNGKNIRDWIYVEDHVDALFEITRKNIKNDYFSIGSNQEKTNINVAKQICKIFDQLDGFKNNKKLISFVEDRKGHDERYGLDATKINKELNWLPKFDFEKGIYHTIEWYKKNQKWWKKINF